MSELGDLLELMHTATHRSRRVRATVRSWTHLERSRAALARESERSDGTFYAQYCGGGQPPETTETLTRLWVERPDRLRSEQAQQDGDEPTLTVVDGSTWWVYAPQLGAITSEGDPQHLLGGDEQALLLDPAPLAASLELQLRGRRIVAGREATVAAGSPRATLPGILPTFGFVGADEVELAVDAERGVLLCALGRLDGRDFHRLEVLEIAYDEELPPETFVFVPPAGVAVRRAGERMHERLTVEQAAARASFRVFVPGRLAAGWETIALYVPPQGEGDEGLRSEGLFLHCSRVDATHSFSIEESGRRIEAVAGEPPREGEQDGQGLQVAGRAGEELSVLLEKQGTSISIRSASLDEEQLLEIAASLVPAPTSPPPVLG